MKRFAPILTSAVLLGFVVFVDPAMATPTPQEWDAPEWGSSGDDDEPLVHGPGTASRSPQVSLVRGSTASAEPDDPRPTVRRDADGFLTRLRDWIAGVLRSRRMDNNRAR
jgi:hypothetical protein